MTCDSCHEDKTVTVEYGITIARVRRDGSTKAETRVRRLCAACGGGCTAEERQS